MVSVGMHIADKLAFFNGIRAALKPGARFGLSDVMRGAGQSSYPLPWAASESTDFAAGPEDYRRLLGKAGFRIEAEQDRTQFSIDYFNRLLAEFGATNSRPTLGLHLVLGPQAAWKTANVIRGLERGAIRQREIIAVAG
jgi:hypothetical protein